MSRQKIDIPIIGIDRRPSERQAVPGLCEVIENLEPTGVPERPYWKRANNVDIIRNNAGMGFNTPDQDKIVSAAWHTRTSVGKYGSKNGSLKRLVVLINDGGAKLRIVDPNIVGGWHTVTEKEFTTEGEYDATFATINNLLTVNVTRDGEGEGIYYIVDDRIIENHLPELPDIHVRRSFNFNTYTIEEINDEQYTGFNLGTAAVMACFVLGDGNYVGHKIIWQGSVQRIGAPDDKFRPGMIEAYLLGYDEKPDDLDFWKDQISGIAIGISKIVPSTPWSMRPLENVLFYDVGGFDFIDVDNEASVNDRRFQFGNGSDETENDTGLTSNRLIDIDPGSAHRLGSRVAFSFNQRLFLGASSVNFAPADIDRGAINKWPLFEVKKDTQDGYLYVEAYADGDYSGHVENAKDLFDQANFQLSGVSSPVVNETTGQLRVTITDPSSNYSLIIREGSADPLWQFNISKELHQTGGLSMPSTLFIGSLLNRSRYRLMVDIQTDGEVYNRVSSKDYWLETYEQSGNLRVRINNSLLLYPDRRVVKVSLLRYFGDNEYKVVWSQEVKGSSTQNIGGAIRTPNLPYIDIKTNSEVSGDDPILLEGLEGYNNKDQLRSGRIQASETSNPFLFLPDKTYYVTGGDITAFATNALPVSQGQYGQYPLYVFTANSVWALEQDADPLVAFGRVSPVTKTEGAASEKQIAQIGQQIVFIYRDGVYLLSGTDVDVISEPIANHPQKPAIDFDSMVLSGRKRAGDNEVLLSDGEVVHVFNLRYGRWYQIRRPRKGWFTHAGTLYGIDSEGKMYDESKRTDAQVAYRIRFEPMNFGLPEQLKRLTAVHLRGKTRRKQMLLRGPSRQYATFDNVLYVKGQSAYAFDLDVSGTMDSDNEYIEALTAQVEVRYPHKEPVLAND